MPPEWCVKQRAKLSRFWSAPLRVDSLSAEFMETAHNLILVDGTGTGETHLATALGVGCHPSFRRNNNSSIANSFGVSRVPYWDARIRRIRSRPSKGRAPMLSSTTSYAACNDMASSASSAQVTKKRSSPICDAAMERYFSTNKTRIVAPVHNLRSCYVEISHYPKLNSCRFRSFC
jgi:hypothetical protein